MTAVLLVWNYVGNVRLCTLGWGLHENCLNFFYAIGISLLPIIPLALFSLITYKMKEEVFQAWRNFSYWFIPLSMVVIALSPQYADGFMMAPSPKGLAVVGTGILYIFISSIIILRTWIKTRKEGEVVGKR